MLGSASPSARQLKLNSILLLIASIILTGWIIYLVFALPPSYRARHWDLAWVGFDLAMLSSLMTTGWAMWKRRQIAIPGAMVSATFLIIDSWFDVVTSNQGVDFNIALASALLIEIPSAILLFRFSRAAVRRSIRNAHVQAGVEIVSLSLWRTPLMIFEREIQ